MLAAPVVLYFLLRLRGMAPADLPDPSMHTTFILDPHAIITRYARWFTPTARLRELARVGFLVPARLSYLLFGTLPGFYVFRYVLALIAIGPLYMLLRRLHGRWAGFVGIVVVMSSPVVITAWGTDYPDSAAVSYLTGAFAALALSLHQDRRQRTWMLLGAGLLTATVWTHGVSVPLAVVMALAYVAIRAWRGREGLLWDLGLMLACGAGVTLLLAILSKLLLGQFNFITPTINSANYLSQPSQEALYHSVSNAWAKYDNYLLVPPAVMLAFIAVYARRLHDLDTAIVFAGVTGAVALVVVAYLQFVGSLQTLEQHYFSSTLWSIVNVLLALTIAELASPIVDGAVRRAPTQLRPLAFAVPALIVLAVPILWEIHNITLHTTWTGHGLALAVAVVAIAVLWRLGQPLLEGARSAEIAAVLSGGAVALLLAGLLVLTVAQPSPHGNLPGVVYDPYPAYSTALGGDDSYWVDSYADDGQIPAFVGGPAYPGEILLQWEPPSQMGMLLGPMGIYHNAFTWVSASFPVLTRGAANKIRLLKAAQVVLFSLTGQDFDRAVASLARFDPVVVKRGVLRHGSRHLHVWLVDLREYLVDVPAPA